MSFRKKFSLALVAFFITLVFQNCSSGFQGLSNLESTSSSAGTSNPQPVPSGLYKNVFMATGHMGRTVMSCDDGVTWINDRSANDAARCWVTGNPNYVECDHTPYSGHGIDSGDGWFFANYGWGYNGSVKKSRDGISWETLRSDGWGGGVAYAKNTLILLWGAWFLSGDNGSSWQNVVNSPANDIDHPHVHRVKDKFIASGRAGGIVISRDQGATWEKHPEFLPEWGARFVEGNGVIVSLGEKAVAGSATVGYSARSTDDGKTWVSQQLFSAGGQRWADLIFDGTSFVTWSGGQMWKSADGIGWTQTPIVSVGALNKLYFSGPVSHDNKTGTYVAIPNAWGNYYEKQYAYRSQNGLTWTLLEANQFKGGHPLHEIIVGEMDIAFCPP